MSILVMMTVVMLFLITPTSESIIEDYLPLVLKIHDLYRTSSVFFLNTGGKSRGFEIATSIQRMSLILSKKGIPMQAFVYGKMSNTTEKYYHRIVRPLYVVFLTGLHTINEFVKPISLTVNIQFPVWLVIFLPLKTGVHPYCHNPPGNLFQLDFNTEMLVLCSGENVIHEWYSLGNNKTIIRDFGKWRSGANVSLLKPFETGLYTRRINMDGYPLRTIVIQSSMTDYSNFSGFTGLYGTLFVELSRRMNFSIDIVKVTNKYGRFNDSSKTWTGAIGDLVENRADIIVTDFWIRPKFLDFIKFTVPVIISEVYFHFADTKLSVVRWDSFLRIFNNTVWYTIVGILIIAPLIITLIEIWYHPDVNLSQLLSDIYLSVFVIFCQRGLSEFPKYSVLKLAYLSLFITAFSIMAYYSAVLTSHVAVANWNPVFNNKYDILRDKSYSVTVVKPSPLHAFIEDAETDIVAKFKSKMKFPSRLPTTIFEGFKNMCEEKVVYLASEHERNVYLIRIPCKYYTINAQLLMSKSFALRKNSPYCGYINHYLQKFTSNGIISRLMKLNTVSEIIEKRYVPESVALADIAPLLAVLILGLILGSFFFFLERLHSLYIERRKLISNSSKKIKLRNKMSYGRKSERLENIKNRMEMSRRFDSKLLDQFM